MHISFRKSCIAHLLISNVLIILEYFIRKQDVCSKSFFQKHSSIGAYDIGLTLHGCRGNVLSMLHIERLGLCSSSMFMWKLASYQTKLVCEMHF